MAAEASHFTSLSVTRVSDEPRQPAQLATRASEWRALLLGLAGVDLIALVGALALAYVLRFKAGVPFLDTPPYTGAFYSTIAVMSAPVWLALLAFFHLYDRKLLFSGVTEYVRIINACTTGLLAEIVISFLDVNLLISRGWLLLVWVLSISLLCAERFIARRVVRAFRRSGRFRTPTLIVGTNAEAQALAEQLMADPAGGPQLVGFIDAALPIGARVVGDVTVVGTPDSLSQTVEELGATEVVVASTAVSREELLELYRTVGQQPGLELRLSSGLFEILTTGMHVQEINRVPLMSPHRVRITGLDALIKTSMDYLGAVLALVILSPVLLALAILVRLDSPGPIIHRRRVLGVSGKHFDAFKFRTMIVNAERRQSERPINFTDRRLKFKSPEDPRVTRVGRFLRRTSLDELPQLLNVLRGEMSLVGPRMIAPPERTRYGKWQHNLLTVKPGITGPWQVQGRGDIPYEERVTLSMQYIRNYSLWLDLEILFRTVLVVVQGRGAY